MADSAAQRVCAVDAVVNRTCTPCDEHITIECTLRSFPDSSPGQFLQLRCGDQVGDRPARETSSPVQQPFLRRPFSIADRWTDDDGSQHLVVISRAIGGGTRWLDRLQPGHVLNLSGPFGRPFRVPDPDAPLVLIGGGVGIPPLLYLARRLKELGHEDVTVIFGAMTRNLFPVPLTEKPSADGTPTPCVRLPGDAAYPAAVTTDDGSLGLRGVVTDALAVWERSRNRGPSATTVFACGPEGMLRAVAARTRERGFACQLCIERKMGCGFGTCLSCVARVRDPSRGPGWRWVMTCSDGPVFERDALFDY